MDNSLLNLQEFYLFTFVTTSNALKAEGVLKKARADFIIIPTLREISSSCGLSIKVRPEQVEAHKQLLIENTIAVEKIYHASKKNNQYLIKEYPV